MNSRIKKYFLTEEFKKTERDFVKKLVQTVEKSYSTDEDEIVESIELAVTEFSSYDPTGNYMFIERVLTILMKDFEDLNLYYCIEAVREIAILSNPFTDKN